MSAVYDVSDGAAYITFDQNLNAVGPYTTGTFTIHQASRWYETGVVTLSAPNVVKVTGINNHNIAGSPLIDYDGSLNTIIAFAPPSPPVASFTGFPCPSQA